MRKAHVKILSVFVLGSLLAAGCATTRPKRPDPAVEAGNQIAQLQNEVQAKDQQIQELQTQVDSYQKTLQNPSNFSSTAGGKSPLIQVPGVAVADLQRALARAGYDPGAVDGRMGRKTKTAIKKFQSASGLRADGVVGKKTWSLLNK